MGIRIGTRQMRTHILSLLTALLITSIGYAKPAPPNIVFIMVDDLGKDWISCYGADGIETPQIDALAKTGLRFDNAYSMPQCTPTRVTLLTGQYTWRTGWVNHWDVPRWGVGYFDWKHYTSFPRHLKKLGYTSVIAGKWQINDFRLEPNALQKHGFDDWCVWTGYEEGNPPSAERYQDAYIHTPKGSKTYAGEYGPDVYCDYLIEFMKNNHDKPMMVYFPMALTHGPLVTTPSEPKPKATKTEQLAAMVRYTDHLVGRLVNTIDNLGIRENTIVIFTTDNGTSGGQRGTVAGIRPSGGKASKYEGGVCQPFIVNCPGIVPAGAVTDALTDFSDLLPTFVELGGGSTKKLGVIDGHSIADVITGKATDSTRKWIMALGHGAARLDADGVRGVKDYTPRVIRDKQFKVWVDDTAMITALYDLKADPSEVLNLKDSSNRAHTGAMRRFEAIVNDMPARDARPVYQKRKPNPWDKTSKDK